MFRLKKLQKVLHKIGSKRLYAAAGSGLIVVGLLALIFLQPKINARNSNDLPDSREVALKLQGVSGSENAATTNTATVTSGAQASSTSEQIDADGTPITSNGLPRHDYDPNVVPKSTKALIISPASVVMYRTSNGYYPQGIKPGIIDGLSLQISSADGVAMIVPSSQDGAGVLMPTGSAPAAAEWNFTINTTYASFGTHTYTVTSRTPSGQTTYAGTIQVEVRQLPTFSASTTLSAAREGATEDALVSGISYGASDLSGVTLSFIANNSPCTNIMVQPGGIHCTLPAGVGHNGYNFTLTFDNQFQHVVTSGMMYVN